MRPALDSSGSQLATAWYEPKHTVTDNLSQGIGETRAQGDHGEALGHGSLVGNDFDNRLESGGGNDILKGQGGRDTLLGKGGDDSPVVRAAPRALRANQTLALAEVVSASDADGNAIASYQVRLAGNRRYAHTTGGGIPYCGGQGQDFPWRMAA